MMLHNLDLTVSFFSSKFLLNPLIYTNIYIYIYIYTHTREGEIIPLVNFILFLLFKKKLEKEEGFHLSVRNLESETRTLSSCK
jgi:hypothetical protein